MPGMEDGPAGYLLSVFAKGVKPEWDADGEAWGALPDGVGDLITVDRPKRDKPGGGKEKAGRTRNQFALEVAGRWLRAILMRRGSAEIERCRLRTRIILARYAFEGVGQSEDFGYSAFHGGALCGFVLAAWLSGATEEYREAMRLLRIHVAVYALHSYRSGEDGSLRVRVPGRRMGSATAEGGAADLATWLGLKTGAGKNFELTAAHGGLLLWGLRHLDKQGIGPFGDEEKEQLRRASLGEREPVARMLLGAGDDVGLSIAWDDRGGFDSGLDRIDAGSENVVAAVSVSGGKGETLRPSDIKVADSWITEESHPRSDGKAWSVTWTGYAFRDDRKDHVGFPQNHFKNRTDTMSIARGPAVGSLTIGPSGTMLTASGQAEAHVIGGPRWSTRSLEEQGVKVPENPPKPPASPPDNPVQPQPNPKRTPLVIYDELGKALKSGPPPIQALAIAEELVAVLKRRV